MMVSGKRSLIVGMRSTPFLTLQLSHIPGNVHFIVGTLPQGWRVGYIAYPDPEGRGGQLGSQLLKTQDTICICACQVGVLTTVLDWS